MSFLSKQIGFWQKNLELPFKVGEKLSLGAKTADLYQKYEKDQVKVSLGDIGPIRIFVVTFVKNISFSLS